MLFPPVFPDLLTPSPVMAAALAAAKLQTAAVFPAAGVHLSAPISIAAVLDPQLGTPTFAYAGFRDTEMFFSASLLKVAAMLAAFELRQSANDFTLTFGSCDATAVFSGMKNTFDTDIENSAPRFLAEPGIVSTMRVPKYATIFAPPTPLASGGCLIAFDPTFADDLRQMIVPSNNNSASVTIQRLGYSWINGLLSRAGLFNQGTEQGIWLAGTFTGAFPAVRVPSSNDGPSAQATTTVDMARFLALLIEGTTLDSRGVDGIADDMRGLLAEAQLVGDSSWMTTGARPGYLGLGPGLTITHCKIGLGNLNAGGDVASEATVLTHDSTGQQFIVVWQNVPNLADPQNAISFLVARTVLNFLGLP